MGDNGFEYDVPDELRVEARGPVRVLTFNNPDQLNAFVRPLHDAMVTVWRQLSDDPGCLAVVLTGAGRAFSAGGDVTGFTRSVEDPQRRRRSMLEARALVDNMIAFPKPVVAAVNGPAVGLGCSVAVLSDIVFVADDTYLADTHVVVGLVAGDGGAMSWPLMTSLMRAKEYLLTGDRIPAEQAVALGLANRVVPKESVLDEAVAFAERLAGMPQQAVQETKRALNLHLQQAAATVLPFALAAESESFTTDDVRRAAERFAERKRG